MMKKNRLFKVATLLLPMLLFSFFSFGQTLKVHATVKDEKGITLPSVSVKIKGTYKGTVADYDGKYTIDVPSSKAVLVFSFVGYLPQEIAVAGKSLIDVTMDC